MSTSSPLRPAYPEPHHLPVALEAWALRRTGSAILSKAIALATEAEELGDACVQLSSADELFDSAALAALATHPWVSDGNAMSACVLTPDGDFYLWRNWRHEARVATALLQRLQASESPDASRLDADLDRLFQGMNPEHCAGQRQAVKTAVGKRLFVLSGGPGTGKTTTVLRILLTLLRQADATEQGSPKIALAAPTGKAAQRLSQAIREGKSDLEGILASGDDSRGWGTALAQVPDGAKTLHRLLGANPNIDGFTHGPEQPLGYDVVVVDEASMVDLAMMRALLDSLQPNATLILVGDPDQLVSVSAGSVLADIVHAAEHNPDGLGRCACRLTHVWRTGSDLAQVYDAARVGDQAGLARLLIDMGCCTHHPVTNPPMLRERLMHWVQRPEWAELRTKAQLKGDDDAYEAFKALRQLQLLSALRAGPYGSDAINAFIDAEMSARNGGSRWYPGRPIVIRHNDYARRLFNGDVGLTCIHDGKVGVYFESIDSEGKVSARHLSPRELPGHDVGYALTVHKSQGSEYSHVAVLLPPDSDNRILSRQLLYTAISRAKVSVELWSTPESLAAALGQLNVRRGGLRGRLASEQVGDWRRGKETE